MRKYLSIKIILILLFILSFSISKGQNKPEDKYQEIVSNYYNFLNEETPMRAIEEISKIIQLDSSFYKIYYMRGYCSLYEAESLIIDRDNCKDSLLIENGIKDLKKCIELYFKNPKDFPSNVTTFKEEYKIKDYIELGERTVSGGHQNIIDGVCIYLSTKGKNKKLACECWNKAKEKKVNGVDLLINEFCK